VLRVVLLFLRLARQEGPIPMVVVEYAVVREVAQVALRLPRIVLRRRLRQIVVEIVAEQEPKFRHVQLPQVVLLHLLRTVAEMWGLALARDQVQVRVPAQVLARRRRQDASSSVIQEV
jgi:hypothetical protein